MRLAVCWIWESPFSWSKFVDSALELERPERARDHVGRMQPIHTRFMRGRGWCPARRHLDACEKAMAWDADLICIIGADQVYEPDMLCRLIERWNQGYEVVSALVPTRGYIPHIDMKPFQPVAYRIPMNTAGSVKLQQFDDLEQYVQKIDPTDGDMQQINFIGSGVLMFHRDHLYALKRPWFYETIHSETQMRLACMDTKFVWRLQTEAGAKVWVDTTIKVKHIHDMEIDETFQDRFMDWAEPGKGDQAICPT
jgi:hypothetical protein